MNKDRIAELKDILHKEYACNPNYHKCKHCLAEAELLGRQEQEKEDNKKFADFLKLLPTQQGKTSKFQRDMVLEKIRELTGEKKDD